MMRERMSRPSSSVPNQWAWEGGLRRAGRLMAAGSRGAIQGANRAKITKTRTSATPAAASGLWRALPATARPNVMVEVDKLACGILLAINLLAVAGEALWSSAIFACFGVPPLPPPSERPAGRGVCKKRRQNLDGKELRGQNLENTALILVLLPAGSTASALTMMG